MDMPINEEIKVEAYESEDTALDTIKEVIQQAFTQEPDEQEVTEPAAITDAPEPAPTERTVHNSPEESIPELVSEFVANLKPPLHKIKKTADSYCCECAYPDISGVAKNPAYARIIQENFCSPVSEFTAAGQYVFDHMVSEAQNKEVSEAFRNISIVEMRHLEMLGELITELGAIPYFKGDWKNKFWQGNFVKYNTNLRTMILCAISDEKKAISQYEKSIRLIRDCKIISLLERIIADEEMHIEIFKDLLKKL